MPASGPGEFVNLLDPMIQLLDAAGNVVATADNNQPDGRNALINYAVPAGAGGTYYIAIEASDATPKPTRGEYVLSQSQ
ncbi:MAG TPA: hypothetical protein DCE44_09285 [Verrucomicrobiales bacterium]|nr:hypothetical protein [Verrucomicrobiales bacterium]